jgi:hypothetical protein
MDGSGTQGSSGSSNGSMSSCGSAEASARVLHVRQWLLKWCNKVSVAAEAAALIYQQ